MNRLADRISVMRAQGQIGPALGLAGVGVTALAMATVALAFPAAAPGLSAAMTGALAACNPFAEGAGMDSGLDSGCGHGFGCPCHALPGAGLR